MKRLLLTLLFWPLAAGAHDPGLSAATVDLSSRELLVQLSFAPADIATLKSPTHAALAARSAELRAQNRSLRPTSIEVREVGTDNVEFTLRFPRPAGDAVLRSPLLSDLPFGHRQAVTIRDAAGALVRTELLSADRDAVSLSGLVPAANFSSRAPFVGGAAAAALSALALAIWLGRRRGARQLA